MFGRVRAFVLLAYETETRSTKASLAHVLFNSAEGRSMKERTSIIRQALGASCIALVLVFSVGAPSAAQEPAPSPLQLLSPRQLDNLVAPIALYPDALLSQVLVASTYRWSLSKPDSGCDRIKTWRVHSWWVPRASRIGTRAFRR
jgi:hypothetical protein